MSMKQIILTVLLVLGVTAQAQNEKAITLEINTEMFVQVVFKSPIQNFKVGMPNLVEAQSNGNTLTVQALDAELKTNLTVGTADGMFYSFILKGTTAIPQLFFEISKTQALNFEGGAISENVSRKERRQVEESQKSVDEKVLEQKGYITSRNTAEYRKIILSLKGIYINSGKLYFLMEIDNKSNIKYDINSLDFITSAKKKSKKQVEAEEQRFEQLYFYQELTDIAPKGKVKFVAVFEKFTLNSDKEMEITLSEKGGERVVRLSVSSETIANAKGI